MIRQLLVSGGIGRRFADAVRALLLRPARHLDSPASVVSVAFLVALFVGLEIALDWWLLPPGAGRITVTWWLVQIPLALLAVLLWFSWLLERASWQVVASDHGVIELETTEEKKALRAPLNASAVFATALALTLLVSLLSQALQWYLFADKRIAVALAAWWLICLLALGWRALSAAQVWRATKLLCLVAIGAPLAALLVLSLRYPLGPYFARAPIDTGPRDKLASEAIWNAQQELVSTRIAALKAQRSGIADVYFVAFAPDASEDVFLRETGAIEQLMESRFDARGRSIRLINHSSQYRTQVAATVTNLRQVLRRFGALMDRNEDVLVLYLTAHGSTSHDLVSKADAMGLENLRAKKLDQLLDEAGIRFAVIAVSACYSGAWVPALARPERLVMTASASDKTSFGCGSESDFTYWGRAVFDEGLRASYSFEQAFQRALPVLRQREREARHPWSDPQIAVGEALRPILHALEQRLTRVSVPVSESVAGQK